MYSSLVAVLLLTSAANGSGGAQVPITSYTCTQPNLAGFLDHGQCTVSGGLRTCAIKEGARPALLSSSADLGVHAWDSSIPPWDSNANPFVVLDIPQGWCVGSVRMTFRAPSSIQALSLSVHNAERLSTNTDRTMFSLVSEEGTRLVVMNLTTLARGKYLRINMTLTGRLYLNEIEVFGTNDSICTHPSSAGGDPGSSTTSVTPASPTTSVTPASPTTSVSPASTTTSVTPASPTTAATPASPTTSVTPASPTTSVTPASPTTSVTPASPTTSVTPASPTTSVTPASPTTSVRPASPTTSVTPASPTTSATPIRAQVPITSYTCTQPNLAGFLDHGQCTVSGGLRTCAIKERARPALLNSSADLGVYAWDSNANPFVVLDIPQGWCVRSVKMTFIAPSGIPTPSLSVHSAERLSTNTDRTVFSLVSEEGTRLVVMKLTTLARGKYLRINMTSTGRLYLNEIEVFGTNDSICTHPSSAGGDPASPTTSVTPASPTTSVTPASPTTSVRPASPTTSVTPASPATSVTPASPTTSVTPASPTTSVTPASPTTSVTPASPTTSVTPANPTTSITPASPTTSVTPANPTTSVTPASPTTSVTPASPTTSITSASPTTSVGSSTYSVTPISTSDYSTTSGPSSTPSQSSTIHSSASFTIFTLSANATPALSARPTTTSVHSSSFTTTPMSSQPSTHANSTNSDPTSTPSPSPSPTFRGISLATDSYVLPAAISAAAVLLLVVLTAIFVVVICIITRRRKTRKSLDMQRLSSVIYRSTQSDATFKDNRFHTGKNGEVPILDANGAVDKDHSGEIRETPFNYTDLGPSESSDSVFQGAAEDPVAEGAISRPTSQASLRSNEVSSKPAHGVVTWVHPSMLDFQNCNCTAVIEESGHYETSPHWWHAGGPFYNLSGCQLSGEGAARDDRHKVLKDAKAQVDTTHQPPPQMPPSGSSIVESVYADALAEAPDKKREPSPISPTYASADPPSSFPVPAATHQFKHGSCPKPSPSAKSTCVPHEDHIYSEVDKSRKKSASSTSSLPPSLTHRADGTHNCTTHQPPPQTPPTALPIAADSAYANSTTVSEKRREPNTSGPTYANIDPPSSFSMLAAAQPSKHGSRPKPFPSTESTRVCQEDHIDCLGGEATASSTSFPLPRLTHRTDYSEVDADFWGGSGNVEGDTVAQPRSITSSTIAKGAVPTQAISNCHIYAAVDYSKKKSRRVKES